MRRLYLVRHGQVATRELFYGHHDLALSERGVAESQAIAAALGPLPIDAVYASDLSRAAYAARLVADARGLEPTLDPAFREMGLGVLEGLTHDEARTRHRHLLGKRYQDMVSYAFPGGESFEDVELRLMPALTKVRRRHAGKTVVLVAHNSVNRILLGRSLGLPLTRVFGFGQDFGCINRIEYDDAGTSRVTLLNWTPDAP